MLFTAACDLHSNMERFKAGHAENYKTQVHAFTFQYGEI